MPSLKNKKRLNLKGGSGSKKGTIRLRSNEEWICTMCKKAKRRSTKREPPPAPPRRHTMQLKPIYARLEGIGNTSNSNNGNNEPSYETPISHFYEYQNVVSPSSHYSSTTASPVLTQTRRRSSRILPLPLLPRTPTPPPIASRRPSQYSQAKKRGRQLPSPQAQRRTASSATSDTGIIPNSGALRRASNMAITRLGGIPTPVRRASVVQNIESFV